MANWDFIFSYNRVATDWLAGLKLPHPAVIANNRLPTTREVMSAWRQYDARQSVLIDDFNWEVDSYVPNDCFKLRGDRLIALRILTKLSQHCGQFWLYPDTGAPAIIVDQSTDAEKTAKVHAEANQFEDSWKYFYEEMYRT